MLGVVLFCFLQKHLQTTAQLENNPLENPRQSLAVGVRAVDHHIEYRHNYRSGGGISSIDGKHQIHTQYGTRQRDVPARAERGAIGRIGRKVLEEANRTDGAIGHHKEHGDYLGHGVYIPHEYKQKGNDQADHRGRNGFALFILFAHQSIDARGKNAVVAQGL